MRRSGDRGAAGMSEPMVRPVFVFGIARSGTNLLARVLDAHSQIEIALDPFMPLFKTMRNATFRHEADALSRDGFDPRGPFQDFYQSAQGYLFLDTLLASALSAPIAPSELPTLRAAVSARAALEAPDIAARADHIAGATCREILASALDIVAACRAGQATRWIGIKEVWVLDFLPALARAFPTAKFIAIERDPRAVIASLAALAAADPTQHAHPISYLRHWRKAVVLARRFASDPALADRFLRVSYEDFVRDPETVAPQLAAFLGVRFEPGLLAPDAASGERSAWQGNSSYRDVVKGISDASLSRWRQSLPEVAVSATEFFCGPEMDLAGYRPVGSAPGSLSETVKDYVEVANAAPGSWRSDCGDATAEIAFELQRRELLRRREPATEIAIVRPCFLFAEAYAAMRAAAMQGVSA
jgi:hypothetical protein